VWTSWTFFSPYFECTPYEFSLFDKNIGKEERFRLAGNPVQLGTNDYQYTVTRNVDESGANSWDAGVKVYRYGIHWNLSELFYLSGGAYYLNGVWGVAWENASD